MKRLAFVLFSPLLLSALSYDVQFFGVDESDCLKALKNASDLVNLKDRPPASMNGLRYRAEADLPVLLKTLRAFAYYDASISYEIEPNSNPVRVKVLVHTGPPFKIASYQIFHGDCKEQALIAGCCPLTPAQLGLSEEMPARSVYIVNAELQVLSELSRCGYPLAYVDKRKVEVDLATREVHAAVCIQEGPYAKFGPSLLFGLTDIHPRFIERRIAWKEGEPYDSDLLEETQRRIMKTDLFSSVYISHAEELDERGELPMQIRFTESKHRQLSLGAYYATADGPGISFAWIHRNLRGMGEVLGIEGDVSKRYLAGRLSYKKPDFLVPDQIYRASLNLSREKIHPYLAFIYGFANYIDKTIDAKRFFTVGFEAEHITISESATNGTYALVGLPFMSKYDTSNNALDPTLGYTLVYQAIAYQSVLHADQRFVKQRFTTTFYIPMTEKKRVVLALRAQVGSIAGAKRKNVPLTKLFLGGSEDDLRGYRYLSVSPLNKKGQSLGGRSAVFATAELRLRFGKFGVVPFADFGTVTSGEIPQLDAKWYKSVGVGARYFAFFGPLRLDVGFPLDRRKVDPAYRFYASVGQAF